MKIEQIILIIQTIILFGGFILALRQLLLLSKQIAHMTEQANNKFDWERKNVTFEYINRRMKDLRETHVPLQEKINLLNHDNEKPSTEDMKELLKDSRSRVELYEMVSYLETLAGGIESNYFDEEVCKVSMGNVIISLYNTLEPYLLLRREETGKRVGNKFEKLVKKWESERLDGVKDK